MAGMTSGGARPRVRMTGPQRRRQLLDIGRELFAQRGFEATSVEEVAARADVSKPVVYEHFGGKEGLYAVVVDREIQALLGAIAGALTSEGGSRALLERAATALLDYIETSTDGFRILVRDSPPGQQTEVLRQHARDLVGTVADLGVRPDRPVAGKEAGPVGAVPVDGAVQQLDGARGRWGGAWQGHGGQRVTRWSAGSVAGRPNFANSSRSKKAATCSTCVPRRVSTCRWNGANVPSGWRM